MKKILSHLVFSAVLTVGIAGVSFAQDKVKIKDLRKNCVKGSYTTCIHLSLKYLKQDPDDFEATYILAQSYAGRSIELHEAYDKHVKEHATMTEKDYADELDLLNNTITCNDSAAFYFEKSSPLLTESFIKKNVQACTVGMGICYNEFSKGTTLESAKKFIASETKRFQDSSTFTKKTVEKVTADSKAKKK